jgi:hypothetical protein
VLALLNPALAAIIAGLLLLGSVIKCLDCCKRASNACFDYVANGGCQFINFEDFRVGNKYC